jgi:hypothetical protein
MHTRTSSLLLLGLAAASLAAPSHTQTHAAPTTAAPDAALRGRLRAVHIATGDVFDAETKARRPLAALVDAVHWTTGEEVVRRELWFGPGAEVDALHVEELERNLRALGLFAEVSVRLVATDTPGVVDLDVHTRDRLSLIVGAGASYVGGVTGLRASLGESNLFGLGNRIAGSFARDSEGDWRGSVAYSDLHVLDSWHTGGVRFARTDDGDSLGLELQRPFKHLDDPRSYAARFDHDELANDFHRDGERVASVDEIRQRFGGDLLWARGPRDERRRLGLAFEWVRRDYGDVRGAQFERPALPGDSTSVFVGPVLRSAWLHGFRKVEGVDTIDFVQDVVLGVIGSLRAGARWRDQDGVGGSVQPEFGGDLGWASEPLPGLLANLTAGGGVRQHGGTAAGWHADAAAHVFALVHADVTLGARCRFDAVEETQDLREELTLGEDNGLRGYPARQFVGARRLLGNLEARCDTGIELATLRLGLVGFVDGGQVGDGSEFDRPWFGGGGGLRIASRPLLGSGVLRIDVARPFSAREGEYGGWQVSVSVGQVFTFGGNTTVAGSR